MTKRSYPVPNFYHADDKQPTTPWEAMQRAGPGEAEESSVETKHPLDGAIARALAQFTELERDIIVMRFVENLSVRQIADMTGISKTVIHRTVPKLQKQLEAALQAQPEIGGFK